MLETTVSEELLSSWINIISMNVRSHFNSFVLHDGTRNDAFLAFYNILLSISFPQEQYCVGHDELCFKLSLLY